MNNDNFLTCPVYSNRFKEQEAECIKYPYDKKDKNVPNDIYFCGNCGVGIAYPPLSKKQLEELYFNGEYWDDSKIQLITPNSFPGQYVLSKSRWDFFKNGIKNNIKKSWSILDVGAGHGFYGMIAADDKDIDVVEYCAIEADKALKESLAKTWNKNNFKTKLEIYDSTEKIDKKYDLIVLSHILEHVLDPKSFLENVSTYLNDGGTLLLGVPNKDYLFKADVFPHLFFFSKKSIEILMESI
ncbi:MAG: class I SAM-dependent methyltransferase [Candidatus Zapsychrus exili]|nr:class I SAM-dependent methyltransferase [Candidatus Zapsychrus exili]